MKHAQTLMLVNAALVFALGLGLAIAPAWVLDLDSPSSEAKALGLLLIPLGLILWILPPLQLSQSSQKRLDSANVLLLVAWITVPVFRMGWSVNPFLGIIPLIFLACLWLLAAGMFGWSLFNDAPGLSSSGINLAGEAAAQQERSRLARDLHDSIKQQLFSIKLSSAAAEERWESDPEGARAALADVRKSSQEAMVEMQALLAQLRPEPLATVGLVEALREQCEALGYRCGIPIHFEIGDLPSNFWLPASTQENLFRIAQEALSNVAHHARARSVHVQLGRVEQDSAPALLLRVRDDGQGFDPVSRPTGMGLRNMKERLEAAGGTLDIDSAPGQGTEVRARMPLTRPKALAEALKKAAFWTLQALFIGLNARGLGGLWLFLWLLLLAASGREARKAVAKAGKDSAHGIGLRLIGHQHHFILLALVFWCTILPSPPGGSDGFFGHVSYPLGQVLGFVAPLSLVLALREAWGLFRLLRSLDGPPPEPILPLWMFAAMLLVFLVSLPCLFLLPDPEVAIRSGFVSYAILYLGWWLRNLP